MNLLNKKWIVKGNTEVSYSNNELIVENTSDTYSLVFLPKVFKKKKGVNLNVIFNGECLNGNAAFLEFVNRKRVIVSKFNLGMSSVVDGYFKYYLAVLYVPANSKTIIRKLDIVVDNMEFNYDDFTGDTLVVSPGYPSDSNRYNCGFVHTRVLEYKKLNWNVDVVEINGCLNYGKYTYQDVNVTTGNFFFLRSLLQRKKYKKILIHFFDNNYANVLESVDLSNTMLYFFLHGAETLYWDYPKYASHYFSEPLEINDSMRKEFAIKDFYIKKYNEMPNCKWIFVTNWTKERCEELLNIKFNNYDIIPCLVNTDLFKFADKDESLRKKIFVIRKFDDLNSYSLDIVVRIILELSRRDFFKDLEFDIYGSGSLHDLILEPIKDLENVHIHNKFLTHEEIRKVHETHGIALFPTRFDSQAVSSCEAAASGCAVITSDIPGVHQFMPDNLGIMCDVENYVEYADVIEKMYNDSAYFKKVAKMESESVSNKFGFDNTIKKEIEMYKNDGYVSRKIDVLDKPILSVIIPSYNVSLYLRNTVYSLLDHRNAGKIEVLIVNDGSKDDTAKIGRELVKQYKVGNHEIVKLIDKENGGHGSTINVGIQKAQGKYVKVVDGDDTVDSEEFAKLIDILEHEDSDIVLNNYIEDFAKDNYAHLMKIYTHLKPGIKYKFDDLCYPQYGFTSWGPILSCSSYKTEMLKNSGYKLLEKTFYVDMQLNTYVAILCDTITYYDLNIYRYFLGRDGQSIARSSYTRNYKHHENVCFAMLEAYYEAKDNISSNKQKYIKNNLLTPMLTTQYYICINYFNKCKPFKEFNSRLKKYPEFYNDKKIALSGVKFHRVTGGLLIWCNTFLVKIKNIFKR